MKTGFKDRTAPKKQDKPVDNKEMWNFESPQYDERSSCYVNAGTNYGSGVRQPVGTTTHSDKSAVPFGRVDTLDLYEAR